MARPAEARVAFIGFLLAHFTGANLCGIADPQLVAQVCEQALEPMNGTGGFDAYAHGGWQVAIERLRFAALVLEPALLPSLLGGRSRQRHLIGPPADIELGFALGAKFVGN